MKWFRSASGVGKRLLRKRVPLGSVLLMVAVLVAVLASLSCAVGTKPPTKAGVAAAPAVPSLVKMAADMGTIQQSVASISDAQSNQTVAIKQVQADIAMIKSELAAINAKVK